MKLSLYSRVCTLYDCTPVRSVMAVSVDMHCCRVPYAVARGCGFIPVHPSPHLAVPCRAVPCRAVPCRAVPCGAVPCCAVPFYAVTADIPTRWVR